MVKIRKKLIAMLVAVTMVAALLIPFVGTASALCGYSMTLVKKVVNNDHYASIGHLVATFDTASWDSLNTASSSASVYLALPSSPNGFAFEVNGTPTTVTNAVIGGTGTVTVCGENSVSFTDPLAATNPQTGYQTLVITVTGPTSDTGGTQVELSIPLTIAAPPGESGSINAIASAQSSSIFASGTIAIATVGTNTVSLAAENTPAIGASGGSIGTIDIKEGANGALYDQSGNSVLTLTLPPGFTWNTSSWSTTSPFFQEWGEGSAYEALTEQQTTATGNNGWALSDNGQELEFYNSSVSSNSGVYFKFTGTVNVDEATAQAGNITLTVGGQTSANVSTLTVGSYGNFGLTCAASGTAPSITAGMEGSTIGEMEITEGIPGSLIWGRTITLTLPNNVSWAEVPSLDTNLSTNTGSDTGFWGTWTSVGSNGNEIQCTVNSSDSNLAGPTANDSSPGDFFLKNMEVTPAVDFSGPIAVTVGGSEGLTGTATLATVAAGITTTAASTPDVQIGTANQALGNITITESAAGNIGSTAYYTGLQDYTGMTPQYIDLESGGMGTAYIDVVAPVGVTFDTTPTVSVTSGNIQLGTPTTGTGVLVDGSTTAGNQGVLQIPVDSSSTTASTITISAPQVTIDRTVPQGPITFDVEGTAVDQTQLGSLTTSDGTVSALFPNDTNAATVNVANVTTNSSGMNGGVAVFTIGQTSYTLNGNTVTMDVAPYIQNNRTYLPLRYVANALGVSDSNIMYDPTSQKVTIMDGSMVVQLTIGSTTMLLNGASITMDTAPMITDGRTCLPVAWVAQALGAQIAWDATAQTATITYGGATAPAATSTAPAATSSTSTTSSTS